MIDPKEITIADSNGIDRKYIISKIPYASGGREICSQYLPTAMPKVGNYQLNHELFLKMMKFVSVVIEDREIPLSTTALIDNHIPDFITGIKIEKEMLEYNTGFFQNGEISTTLKTLSQNIQPFLIKILSQLKDFSSQKGEQRSKS